MVEKYVSTISEMQHSIGLYLLHNIVFRFLKQTYDMSQLPCLWEVASA